MVRPFRFGVVSAMVQSRQNWIQRAQQAEASGYSTLLIPDRLNVGSLAPFTALAVAAEATKTLRVGSYVFCNGYRHPVVLAREAATLDLLSEGRLELGLGAGVGESEFAQLGIPFESPGTRLGQLAETVGIIKGLFTDEKVTFTGKYYTLTDIKGSPRPVQNPPPLLLAGTGERMLRLAAREANIIAVGEKWGGAPDASLEQKIAWIREEASERFVELELSQTVYDMEITDSPHPLHAQPPGMHIPKRSLSTEQAVDWLQESRARYGFSYFQIYDGQMANFAPVVEHLHGK